MITGNFKLFKSGTVKYSCLPPPPHQQTHTHTHGNEKAGLLSAQDLVCWLVVSASKPHVQMNSIKNHVVPKSCLSTSINA